MTTATVENNSMERREKRAKSIAAMGLVNRVEDRFHVSTPSLRGRQTSYEVWRDEQAKIRCNCLEFEENFLSDETFRCEHILAVKHSLVAKNTEAVTKQTAAAENKTSAKIVSKSKNATESSENSELQNEVRVREEKSETQNPKSKTELSALGIEPVGDSGNIVGIRFTRSVFDA